MEDLADEPKMTEAVQAGIDAANERLARVEQIKKFTIVRGDWLPGGDELTPTIKLKRKPIAAKYAEAIERMYGQRCAPAAWPRVSSRRGIRRRRRSRFRRPDRRSNPRSGRACR